MNEFQIEPEPGDKNAMEKMLRASVIHQGELWLMTNGEAKLKDQMMKLDSMVRSWRSIMASSIRLNVATVEAMMTLMSLLSSRGAMDIITRPPIADLCGELSAIRNHLIRENEKKAAIVMDKSFPQSGDGQGPKA